MQTIKLKGKRIRFETNLFGNDPNLRRPDRRRLEGPPSSSSQSCQTRQVDRGRVERTADRLVQELNVKGIVRPVRGNKTI